MNIINGDSGVVLTLFPDEYFDLVVTSPPYDNLRNYDATLDWNFVNIAKQLTRTLKNGGVIVWNVNDSTVDGSETGTSFRQALHFIDECGLRLHDTMIWQKPNFSNPSRNRYHQVFEYVFILSKGAPKTFNPIYDRKNIGAGKIGNWGSNAVTQVDGSRIERKRTVISELGMRHNVWLMKTAGQAQESTKFGHPAMFTIEFASDHIKSWSDPGDLVLDPFAGSGSTAIAAQQSGRRWLMIEKNEKYCQIIRERLKT